MVFKYKWSDREKGNFAIRKRSVKGIEAGKKIEPKKNQTSDTHFFILVDKNDVDSMYNALHGINVILENVEYDYREKETNKKSGNAYLTKKDIEDVLNNIDQYKNGKKTKTIETAFSKSLQQKKIKLEKGYLKKWRNIFQVSYGFPQYRSIMNMLITSITKKQELKKKQLETETQIKELKKDLLKTETTISNDIENFEKTTFTILKKELKHLQYNGGENDNNFQNLLEVLYDLANFEIRNKKSSKIQQRYRDKKRNGKPKLNVGRPKKTK